MTPRSRLLYSEGYRSAQREARERMREAYREHVATLEELMELKHEVGMLHAEITAIRVVLRGGREPGELVH
jgi:hypothetical protein